MSVMALKNPNIYPQWSVLVWTERFSDLIGWTADCKRIDSFDNEYDALTLYESIHLADLTVEVDLEMDTGFDTVPVRHKDTAGEYIY